MNYTNPNNLTKSTNSIVPIDNVKLIELIEPIEPNESIEPNEPIEPIEQIEPIEPIEQVDEYETRNIYEFIEELEECSNESDKESFISNHKKLLYEIKHIDRILNYVGDDIEFKELENKTFQELCKIYDETEYKLNNLDELTTKDLKFLSMLYNILDNKIKKETIKIDKIT